MIVPRQGDIVFIDAEPHAGREEGGHNPATGNVQRPLIVLSNNDYNKYSGMVIGMMLTSTPRKLDPGFNRSFLDVDSGVHGQIIMWQLPNLDFKARNAKIVGRVSDKLLNELRQRAKDIFD